MNNDSNRIPSKEHIQEWISEILEKYKQKFGYVTLPICEKSLCKVVEELRGISITIEPDKKASVFDEGLLLPVRGGFIIKYGTLNKNQEKFPNVKIRETICHELAHILFFDCTFSIPRLQTISPEYLCHDIARQILLPDQIVKEKFSEKIKTNSNLIDIIRHLARDFQAAFILMIKRLTEDLSILNDTVVTIWRYKFEKGKQTRYEGYHPDPKLSPEIKKLLPKYWRDQIHTEAWEKVVSKVAIGNTNNLPGSLYVEGKKKMKGRIKSIPFKIQCVPLYDRSNNLTFGWKNIIKPALGTLLSVKKFDLSILENGK